MIKPLLDRAVADVGELLPKVAALAPQLQKLCDAMWKSWEAGGKVLTAGNGGSASDAMHLAEELVVRFVKNRKAMPAVALCDPTVITCAGNDFGYESIFSRQIEAIGKPGDVLIVFSTSGNSANILRALEVAKAQAIITAGLLGRDGGKAAALCDIPLIVPASAPHRIQEGHKILYHTICEFVDAKCD